MVYLATILAYLVVLFLFGLRYTKRLKRKEDFLVAGRTLSAPILVVRRCTSDRSRSRRPLLVGGAMIGYRGCRLLEPTGTV